MHLISLEIVILIGILVLIGGVTLGLLISTYIFEEPIEKSKSKKPIPIDNIEWIYKCPTCKGLLTQEREHCDKCGQKLDFKGVIENENINRL